jgi:hypothetical protein
MEENIFIPVQYDGGCVHLLHRLPPLQGRGDQEESGLDHGPVNPVGPLMHSYVCYVFFYSVFDLRGWYF